MIGMQKEGGPLVPLRLTFEGCETDSNLSRNILRTIQSPYTRFNEYVDSQSGAVSICGFGPSLADTYKDLVGDVLACNGAHDWLISKGIIPKWAFLMDAAEVMTQFITPHKDVTYLVASRCHESLFKHLEGFNVVVWHCKEGDGEDLALELLEKHQVMEPLVSGGTAAVTRSMVLALTMGYNPIHLFGADSSYEGEFTHVNKSLVPERELMVYADHKWFKSTPWMAGQVEDFRILAPPNRDLGARFIIHGNGLLPHVAASMGFERC